MLTGAVNAILSILTWSCVCLLAVLSLLPAREMVRTGIPGEFEHFAAYAASTSVAMAAYGRSRNMMAIIALFWGYAGLLEYLQQFSPGRHPAFTDFAASAAGALSGGLAVGLLMYSLSKGMPSDRA